MNATDYGYGAAGNTAAQNGAALQTAVTAAAAAAPNVLFLPPGDVHIDRQISLPTGFAGWLTIAGCGKKTSRVIMDTAGVNGLYFDLSAGVLGPNSIVSAVELKDFSVLTNTGVVGDVAITITYGGATGESISYGNLSSVTNIEVGSLQPSGKLDTIGGWTDGFDFVNCWNLCVFGCFSFGSLQNYNQATGPGTGQGFAFTSCENAMVSQIWSNAWAKNIDLPAPLTGVNNSSVTFMGINCVEGLTIFHSQGSSVYLTGFIFDNGNATGVANKQTVVLENLSAPDSLTNSVGCFMTSGQILQNGGTYGLQLLNCAGISIDNVSFALAGTPAPSGILLDSKTTGCVVENCLGGPVLDQGANNTVITSVSKLIDISTRGFVGVGANILIGGFVIGGTEVKSVLVRASGPALSQFGVTGVLADPKLQIFSGSNLIAQNIGWGGSSQIAAAAAKSGAFPWSSSSSDSALVLSLQPGAYTAQVSGASGDTGDALIEVYDLS